MGQLFKNTASQKVRVFAFADAGHASLDPGEPVTGDAANITAQTALDNAALGASNDTNPAEVDATNAPGTYEFDPTQAETNGDVIEWYPKSSTAGVQVKTVGGDVQTLSPPNLPSMGIESDGDLTKVNTLDGHTAQTGDTFAQLPTNFSDLSITATTGRVDVSAFAGQTVQQTGGHIHAYDDAGNALPAKTDVTGLNDPTANEIRNAITGGAYALDTDANGRIRLVVGTAAGEVNLSSGKAPATLAAGDVTGNLPADAKAVSGDTTAADNLEADYDGTGYNKSNSTIGTTTTNTDMRGTDNALTSSDEPIDAQLNATQPNYAPAKAGDAMDFDSAAKTYGDSNWATATGFSTFDHTTDEVTTDSASRTASQADVSGLSTHSAADVWSAGTRTLTGLSNVAADIRSAIVGYIRLILRKDAAVATDESSRLTEINSDGGTGGGSYDNADDAQEAIRDRGDSAWTTGAGGSAPTVEQIRTEMDDNSTKLASILTDTGTTLPTQITGLNDPTAADIRSEIDSNSTQLAAVKAKTDNLPANPAATGDAMTLATAALNFINAEVDKALANTNYNELGSVPAANAPLADKINWLYMLARNKRTTTSSQDAVRDDGDASNVATSTLSDDGTTFTRGEYS